MQGEVAGTVLAALARLPLSLRVPVVLRYYADLSERDIALAIGRRPGTVKSRLHEARRRLAADPALSCPRRPRGLPIRSGDRTMTMLDDDQLATLFARAAADFELPESGPAEILVRARRDGARSRRGGREVGDAGSDAVGDAGAPSRWREGRLRRAGASRGAPPRPGGGGLPRRPPVGGGHVGALGRGTSSPTATLEPAPGARPRPRPGPGRPR